MYDALSYRELQAECKRRGLKASGRKDEILDRLRREGQEEQGREQPIEPQDEEGHKQKHQEEQSVASSFPPSGAAHGQKEASSPTPAVAAAPAAASSSPTISSPFSSNTSKRGSGDTSPSPRKRSGEAEKPLKSPGSASILPGRDKIPRPGFNTGIKKPSTISKTPLPSSMPGSLTAATASAASSMGPVTTAKKPGAASAASPSLFRNRPRVVTTTTTMATSSSVKKPLASGPTPFGPGTYCNSNVKAAAVASVTTSAHPANAAKPKTATTITLPPQRPKLNYKPHTGKLPPFGQGPLLASKLAPMAVQQQGSKNKNDPIKVPRGCSVNGDKENNAGRSLNGSSH